MTQGRWLCRLALFSVLGLSGTARAASVADLLRAYPEQLRGFDGANLIWRDGTSMPVGEAHPGRTMEELHGHGSILDQIALAYPAGVAPSPQQDDPGRIRNQAFFDKMYGNCRTGEVAAKLVPVDWLPKSWGHTVSITSVNGVDRRLAAISRELDELPAEDKKFLFPLGGTYNCRPIAGTDQKSMHSWGAAIDLNPAFSTYWRWNRAAPYQNALPSEIVTVFERHGFIWGGRWSHFDTMHFEYRPELLGYHPDASD